MMKHIELAVHITVHVTVVYSLHISNGFLLLEDAREFITIHHPPVTGGIGAYSAQLGDDELRSQHSLP